MNLGNHRPVFVAHLLGDPHWILASAEHHRGVRVAAPVRAPPPYARLFHSRHPDGSGTFAPRVLARTTRISPSIQSISHRLSAINSVGLRLVQKANCSCAHVSPLDAFSRACSSSGVKGSMSSSSLTSSRFRYDHPESGWLSIISSSIASFNADRKQVLTLVILVLEALYSENFSLRTFLFRLHRARWPKNGLSTDLIIDLYRIAVLVFSFGVFRSSHSSR